MSQRVPHTVVRSKQFCKRSYTPALDRPVFALLLPLSRPPFAGKSALLAESSVRSLGGAPILALAEETTLQEDNMTARRTSSQSLKSIIGAGAIALGLVLLFVNLDGVASQVSGVICTQAEAPGMLATIGLAGLHALQAYKFDHARFLPGLLQILVSFWPLVLIVAGAALLRSAFSGRPAKFEMAVNSSGERAR
jgi:hypothetical protein